MGHGMKGHAPEAIAMAYLNTQKTIFVQNHGGNVIKKV